MAQQHDLASKTAVAEPLAGRGYAVGQRLSRIFHPIILNIVSFLIVGYYGLGTHRAGLAWAAVCVLLQTLPPTIFYRIRFSQGAYSDADVSDRRQRTELYAVGLLTVGVGIALLLPFGLPRPFLALLVCAFALGLIGGVVNLFWKISVHAASIASTATVALLFSRTLGVALWLCALAVGWARIRTKNHTPLQVLAGFAVAAAVVLVVFRFV